MIWNIFSYKYNPKDGTRYEPDIYKINTYDKETLKGSLEAEDYQVVSENEETNELIMVRLIKNENTIQFIIAEFVN